jgi:hypothetical protein
MIPAAILLAVAVVWRVLLGVSHSQDFGWLHNFAPLSAIALCGATLLPRRWAIILPLVALYVSDVLLNLHYGVSLFTTEMLGRYVALAGIAFLGFSLRKSPKAAVLMGASVTGSAFFYIVTNSASWVTEPQYAKTFAGWIQALTTGVPGYPTTISFYRNTLASDILFTMLFIACMRYANRAGTPALAHARA